MNKFYYEEGLDEVLMFHNPNGGRPMHIGSLVYQDKNTQEIENVREDTLQRFFLGYCACGKKIVIGYKRAELLARIFQRKGIKPSRKTPLRVRLARKLINGVTLQGNYENANITSR